MGPSVYVRDILFYAVLPRVSIALFDYFLNPSVVYYLCVLTSEDTRSGNIARSARVILYITGDEGKRGAL